MAASDIEGDSDGALGAGGRAAALLRRVGDVAYGPVVVLATLVQLGAVLAGAVELALAAFVVGALVDLATWDEQNEVRGRLRRFGLGLLQRVTYRAVLLLALLAPDGIGVVTVTAYVVGLLALGLATRGVAFAVLKVVREAPAMPERNLGEELPLTGRIPVLRRRRLLAVGLLAATELPLALALWLGAGGATAAAVTVVAATSALSLGVTVAVGWWARGFLRSERFAAHVRALEEAVAATGARIVLYFSGDREGTYQINQWMPVVERLDEPVLIVLRERGHLERMPATRHPVLYCRRHRDVEVALACDPMVALYVGQAGRNIHFLRYARPKHVFLNHGDSDKVSSANPVVKAYDRLFVAGEIAIERYRDAGVNLPDERFTIVGRPQLDGVLDGRQRLGEGPTTVLYAPTWEGYFEAADYSSLERSGPALIERLLRDHPELKIVFKPHPASGTVRPQAGAAMRRVEALLREAGGHHVLAVDHPELDLLAWFDRSDVLISDISAVVTDFLATDKPYLVTNPRGLTIEEFRRRFPSHHAAYVVDQDLGNLGAQLAAAAGDDPLAADRAAMKRRVLGDLPGGSFAAFTAALADVRAEAERDAVRVVNTFAYE